MSSATLTSKGQLTLPISIREKLGLHAGSKVEFIEQDDGSWKLSAKTGDIRALKGILKYQGPSISIEDMDEAMIDAAVAGYLKSVL